MELWPLTVYFGAVVVLVVAMLGVSYVLGERQQHPESKVPYEGGITSEGSARVRLSARFYLIAMFFVLFDLEAVYLFSWAVAAREAGWAGFLEVAIFVAVLLAALVWLWRIGALDLAALRVGPPKEIPKHAPTRQRDA